MSLGYIRIAATLYFVLLTGAGGAPARAINVAKAPLGVILVSATVEGRDATLLLDTGAESSCIDAEFAKRLKLITIHSESIHKLYGTEAADTVRVDDIRVDSFILKNRNLLATDLSAISSAAGVPVSGILGSDILREFEVTIDFSSGSAHFAINTPSSSEVAFVGLRQVRGLYFVPVDIQGTHLSLLLDTGTNASSLSSQAWSTVTMHWQPKAVIDGIRSSGGTGTSKYVLIPRVEIGGIVARDNPLRVQPQADAGLFADSDFDGLIGADLLSHFIVTLDLAHDRIGLKRDLKCHTDLDRFSTIGIQFMKDPGGSFTIMSVWSPSPAGDAGLKIGDRVLSVNRMETDPMSLDDLSSQIHGTPGTKVQLLIDSGGQHRDVSMAITCLLCPTESTSER